MSDLSKNSITLGPSNDDPALAAQNITGQCEAGWVNTGAMDFGCILFKNVEIHSSFLYDNAEQYCQTHGAQLVFNMCSSCSSRKCMFDGRCDGPSNIICQKQNTATATTQDSTTLDLMK